MISILRTDAHAIEVVFDEQGRCDLLSAVDAALIGGIGNLLAVSSKSVTKSKRGARTTCVLIVSTGDGELVNSEKNLQLSLDADDLTFWREKLEETGVTGNFYPAEFVPIAVPQRRASSYLYCRYDPL